MTGAQHTVFTVGHSSHSMEGFVSLLQKHRVHEVVDIRSSPYSRYTAHFNFDVIGEALDQIGIRYVFLGGALGGRPMDPYCYDTDGRVRYDRIANTDLFDDSIRDLTRGADERRIALMCTEKDPLDCHRTLLVSPSLVAYKVNVEHILADGSLENHDTAMDRLMDSFKLPPNGDLFRPRAEVIEEALSRQAKRVGHVFKVPVASDDHWSSSS